MGGTDEKSNLVELSVEGHAEAHRKLYEEHGNWQDYLAWQGLLKLLTTEECGLVAVKKGYQKSRAAMTDSQKNSRAGQSTKEKKHGIFQPEYENRRKQILLSNIKSWTGKHHTKETKDRIAEANRGKVVSLETRAKLSKASKEYHRRRKIAGVV
jgi:hypothetical protein